MRCPNCQTINPAGAKFCLECGNRLIVCPRCGTVNPPSAKFCIECGLALTSKGESTAPLPAVTVNSTQRTQPSSVSPLANGHRNSAPLELPEERRVVTVMFADITGSTPLADRLEPEDMRAILTGYFNLMTEQIRKHGGTVEKYIGDAVMAVFGAPIAHEDDPDRAIRAALDMQAALATFNQERQMQEPTATRLQMRIGINTGEVATPGNTSAQGARQDFLITGDAVNVAARLQQIAVPDTILVGERTYFSTRDGFNFHSLAPLHLKGKPEPIRAYVVVGLHTPSAAIPQRPRGIEGLQTPLVGRTLELALMHATYARVQAEQHPHLITLLGVPGIGKTRLVREFVAKELETARCVSCENRLAAPKVLQGRCPPYGEGITYWPLIEILRSLLQVQDEESSESIQKRFFEFVQDSLSKARSIENPEQVAHAIIHSIGGTPEKISQSALEKRQHTTTTATRPKTADQTDIHIALMRAWRILLEALAQQEPLMIVIDDLHWADEALLDLLEYLMDRITNVPILFLCPARPDFYERRREWGGGRHNFTTIVLEALSREESNELVNELIKTEELPGVLRHTILRQAEGNPFFVEEMVRMLIDQGVLAYQEGCWSVSTQSEDILSELASPAAPPEDTLLNLHYVFPLPRVPDTIQGVLAARVDLLNTTEKLVLQHAAIIGRTFWMSALLKLAFDLPIEVVHEAMEALVERGFIVEAKKQGEGKVTLLLAGTRALSADASEPDRVFSFKHVLTRDVVYNNIPRMRRSHEHAQLGLWLEKHTRGNIEAFAELLAYHYQQALATWSPGYPRSISSAEGHPAGEAINGAVPRLTPTRLTRSELRLRAVTYLSMAGDQAFHRYHTIRAIQAYSEVLELLADSEADAATLTRMHEKLGDAYTQRMNLDEAWQEYRKALQLHLESEQATSSSEAYDSTLLHLYNRLAELGTRWLHLFKRFPDAEEVRGYIDAGLKLLEGQPTSGEYATFLTHQAFWYTFRQTEAAEPLQKAEFADLALHSSQEALHIAETLNDTSSLWITLDALGYIYREQNKYQDAHQTQHYRLQLADQIENRAELYDLYYALGRVHDDVADYPTAVMWLGRAWQIAQTTESPSLLLNSMVARMYTWYHWNRWNEASEVAHSILQMVEQYQQQNEPWQLEALKMLADLAYRTGQQEQGDNYVRQYKRLAEQPPFSSELTISIQLAREDWVRAMADSKEQLQGCEPFPSPRTLALLAELEVITGESSDVAQARCERAVTLAEQSGARKTLIIALRARGRWHVEQQHWTEAEQDLQRSIHQAQEFDLPWEQGQTLYCLGLLYRRRADVLDQQEHTQERTSDLGRAHFHFEKALGFFESLGAVRDAERARLGLAQDSKARV